MTDRELQSIFEQNKKKGEVKNTIINQIRYEMDFGDVSVECDFCLN
ncbi:MAG: hypothetical protein AAB066_01190 [Candidatus Margulisiibacteriota bacterium]